MVLPTSSTRSRAAEAAKASSEAACVGNVPPLETLATAPHLGMHLGRQELAAGPDVEFADNLVELGFDFVRIDDASVEPNDLRLDVPLPSFSRLAGCFRNDNPAALLIAASALL